MSKIKVGISIGDLNGIGLEIIIKTFKDSTDDGLLHANYFWIDQSGMLFTEKHLRCKTLILIS